MQCTAEVFCVVLKNPWMGETAVSAKRHSGSQHGCMALLLLRQVASISKLRSDTIIKPPFASCTIIQPVMGLYDMMGVPQIPFDSEFFGSVGKTVLPLRKRWQRSIRHAACCFRKAHLQDVRMLVKM